MTPPTFADIVAAREAISDFLPKTPLVRLNNISELLNCDYYAKLENLQPTGAFKVRGGINLIGHEMRLRTASGSIRINHSTMSVSGSPTFITASTGNHGQSIAYAGRLFGARVIIYAPTENINESKMQAIRDLGAEVRLHGRDFAEARLEVERLAREGLSLRSFCQRALANRRSRHAERRDF